MADDCAVYAPVFVTIYLVFNQAYNLLIILIIKYGSSNLLFMALTIMVPLGNFAFTLPFVPGHAPLQITDILGLVIICTGLGAYRFMDTYLKSYHNGMLCGYKVVLDDEDDELDEEDLEGAFSGGGGLHIGGHAHGIDKNPLLDKKFLDDVSADHTQFAILEGETMGSSPGGTNGVGLGTYENANDGSAVAAGGGDQGGQGDRYSVSEQATKNAKHKGKGKKNKGNKGSNANANTNHDDNDSGSERGLSLHDTSAMRED
tara:strand:- start:169 stop:945 length:777 start_codon:yes stop_codon:yes gene_type:complete